MRPEHVAVDERRAVVPVEPEAVVLPAAQRHVRERQLALHDLAMYERAEPRVLMCPKGRAPLDELVGGKLAHARAAEDVDEHAPAHHLEAAVEEGVRPEAAGALAARLHRLLQLREELLGAVRRPLVRVAAARGVGPLRLMRPVPQPPELHAVVRALGLRRLGRDGAQLGDDPAHVDERVVVHLGDEGRRRVVGRVDEPRERLLGDCAATVRLVRGGGAVVRAKKHHIIVPRLLRLHDATLDAREHVRIAEYEGDCDGAPLAAREHEVTRFADAPAAVGVGRGGHEADRQQRRLRLRARRQLPRGHERGRERRPLGALLATDRQGQVQPIDQVGRLHCRRHALHPRGTHRC